VIYLDVEDLLYIARRVLAEFQVRDVGLLEAAAARPQARAFGPDAYQNVHAKAAALVHSIARNHALIDGNKRLALAALLAFYGVNGYRLTMTNDQAYDLIMAIASGDLDDVDSIAAQLRRHAKRWGRARRSE
jgi:death on curing protein